LENVGGYGGKALECVGDFFTESETAHLRLVSETLMVLQNCLTLAFLLTNHACMERLLNALLFLIALPAVLLPVPDRVDKCPDVPGKAYLEGCPEPAATKAPEVSAAERNDGMVLIPGGWFEMGSNENDDEKPVHRVTVSDFYLGKYEVTVEAFKAFINATGYKTDAERKGSAYGYEGSGWKDIKGCNWRQDAEGKPAQDKHPVVYVSWNDAYAYCRWLNKKVPAGQKPYRLPTEAEFEYAAGNGAKHTKYSWGGGDPVNRRSGNVAGETDKVRFSNWPIFNGYTDGYVSTAPVGSFEPNEFGLYDMSGNVWEWCSDWYGADYYKNSPPDNPKGPASGSDRVVRGGSWFSNPQGCRVAYRGGYAPGDRFSFTGFRLARTR
jgi:formylglycine-generating enzyme